MTTPALAQNIRGKGRHYEHPDTGEFVPSVTNAIGVLDKPALPRWSAKMVAQAAWKMRHSLVEMGEDECIDVLKGSPWRKSTRAADRGTSIHDYLDTYAAKGADAAEALTEDMTREAKDYLPAARSFLTEWSPEFVHNEFTVFGEGYAGTGDFIARMGGTLVLGDYKTSKAIYPEVALQLAALRYASQIVTPDGLAPMPDVDGCVAVLITPRKAEVYPVRAGAWEYRAFRACLAAWEWTKGEKPVGTPWLTEVAS